MEKINIDQQPETNVDWFADGERANATVLNRPIKQVATKVNEVIDEIDLVNLEVDTKAASDGTNATGTWPISITGSATTLTTPRNISLSGDVSGSVSFNGSSDVTITAVVADDSHNHSISTVTGLQAALDSKLNTSLKGAVNGLAELNSAGQVPATQLPSYVDDVLEFADFASFPVTGETSKIYIDLANNDIYRWSGSTYIQISNSVGSSDTANRLATPRTISLSGDVSGSTSFDGSANVTITTVVADDSHNHSISTVTGLQGALDSKANTSGSNASGTWPINITGSAASASSASNSDTVDGLHGSQFIRNDVTNTATGRVTFSVNGRGTDYTTSSIELHTNDNTPPSLSFHRGGYSAVSLREQGGQLYINGATGDGLVYTSSNLTVANSIGANYVVQRDVNGYIYANYINFNTTVENPVIANFITDNGDGWTRKSDLTHVANSIRGAASGTWAINISGDANTLDGLDSSYFQPASTAITTSNIGSQSVNYATSSNTSTFLNTSFGVDLETVTANGIYREESPTSGFWYTTTLNMSSSDGRQQLTIARDGSGMKFRGSVYGSGDQGWSAWKTVLDSSNYSSFAAPVSHSHDASQITSGTFASARLAGTYNINITGSAGSASNADTLDGLDSTYFQPVSIVSTGTPTGSAPEKTMWLQVS